MATPNRADGEGMGEVFQEIVHDLSILDAINQGWLANIRGVRIRTTTLLDRVRTLAGDFNLGDLGSAVNTPQRNDLIVREWLKQAENRQTVAFCVDVAHAQYLAQALKGYGISAEAVWGGDPDRSDKLKMHQPFK
jgi:superfamily II DNA or RNA helicase